MVARGVRVNIEPHLTIVRYQLSVTGMIAIDERDDGSSAWIRLGLSADCQSGGQGDRRCEELSGHCSEDFRLLDGLFHTFSLPFCWRPARSCRVIVRTGRTKPVCCSGRYLLTLSFRLRRPRRPDALASAPTKLSPDNAEFRAKTGHRDENFLERDHPDIRRRRTGGGRQCGLPRFSTPRRRDPHTGPARARIIGSLLGRSFL